MLNAPHDSAQYLKVGLDKLDDRHLTASIRAHDSTDIATEVGETATSEGKTTGIASR